MIYLLQVSAPNSCSILCDGAGPEARGMMIDTVGLALAVRPIPALTRHDDHHRNWSRYLVPFRQEPSGAARTPVAPDLRQNGP